MANKTLAIAGIIVFLIGITLGFLLVRGSRQAGRLDNVLVSGAPIDINCDQVIREASVPRRTMTEQDTQSLTVVLANDSGPGVCETTLYVAAPNFILSPAGTERQVSLEAGATPLTMIWIISPLQTGSFEIAVSAGNQSQTIGVTVTNILGLTAAQAQLLSYLAIFFGPMLTAPWWYEQWQKWRKERQQETAAAQQPGNYRPE